jgi:hypothetical protein
VIARLGYFDELTDEQRQVSRDNWERRFGPALKSQPGLVCVLHVDTPDGKAISISVWESVEALRAGGQRANAVPLLPGQEAGRIPGASRQEICVVQDFWVNPSVEAGPPR